MIYLINARRILSTDKWKERHSDKTIEEFAEENGYQKVDVIHDKDKPIMVADFEKDEEGKYVFNVSLYEKRTGIRAARIELEMIRLWFAKTDYIPHKVVTEEWTNTDPRFIEYKQERNAKRIRQDELNKIIGV